MLLGVGLQSLWELGVGEEAEGREGEELGGRGGGRKGRSGEKGGERRRVYGACVCVGGWVWWCGGRREGRVVCVGGRRRGEKGERCVCGGGVEFLCSHETTAQCCDNSFSVKHAQLVASVLTSTLTSHARFESYQSQTHFPSQRAQHKCDTCLTLHGSGAEPRTPSCCAAGWNLA